ncbi:MAG: biotin/lipoyl-binding protein [Deferribacteraceae bacterium]|jgi:biotin carboxyl carrier protein|nr:biotin/lipoyl-binding protein [Deferribacteraceae bacterium]
MAKILAKYFAQVEGDGDYVPVEIISASSNIYKLSVDGKEYVVDYADSKSGISFIINNVSYGVDISKKGTIYDVQRADDHFRVEVLDEMKKFMKERVSKELQGRQIIDTQMPGLILKILVEKGQEVSVGTPLMILVAMKMENEIKSPKSGVVQDIFVKEGGTVGTGDKLIIID